jgi:hypothetical protein
VRGDGDGIAEGLRKVLALAAPSATITLAAADFKSIRRVFKRSVSEGFENMFMF